MDFWSKLPEHLVEKFAEKLDNHMDFVKFGAVCKSWRSVFENNTHRLPSKCPMSCCLPKALPLFVQHDMKGCRIRSVFDNLVNASVELSLSVPENKYVFGSSEGFLLLLDYTRKLDLLNPLTGVTRLLPPMPIHFCDLGSQLVVYLERDGRMVVILSDYSSTWWCRVGDQEWNYFYHGHHIQYMMHMNGMVYALDKLYNIYEITLSKKKIYMQAIFMRKLDLSPTLLNARKYLVQSSGELLLVIEDSNLPRIEMFKLTFKHVTKYCARVKRFEWEKVENISNQMLFLARTGSFCVESSLHPGTEGNCVYFPRENNGCRCMAVYNLRTKCLHFFPLNLANLFETFWFSPNPW